jgi:hypothetical protein
MDTDKDSPVSKGDVSAPPSKMAQIRRWYRGLPDKKRYLELITAFLSIPVLFTVLLSNVTTLKSKAEPTPTPSQPTTVTVYITPRDTVSPRATNVLNSSTSPTPTPQHRVVLAHPALVKSKLLIPTKVKPFPATQSM